MELGLLFGAIQFGFPCASPLGDEHNALPTPSSTMPALCPGQATAYLGALTVIFIQCFVAGDLAWAD